MTFSQQVQHAMQLPSVQVPATGASLLTFVAAFLEAIHGPMATIGFKVYGVDSEHYLGWLGREDVYPGSQAMCLSFRPFARIE